MARSDKLETKFLPEIRELLAKLNTRANDLIEIRHSHCEPPVRPVVPTSEDKPVTEVQVSPDKPVPDSDDKDSVNKEVVPEANISIGPYNINSHEDWASD